MDKKLWTPTTAPVIIRQEPKSTSWLPKSMQELEQRVADELRGLGFNVK